MGTAGSLAERPALSLRQALILRWEIRAAVAGAAHVPLDPQLALGIASFRAGWRDEIEASDWFFVMAEVDAAAYGRGRERAKAFREAVRAEGRASGLPAGPGSARCRDRCRARHPPVTYALSGSHPRCSQGLPGTCRGWNH